MKKSFLALMLAVALVSLSACGNQEKAPEATATPVVTEAPTEEPTAEPTEEPTAEPTEEPTAEPTEAPTAEPTEEPVVEQSDENAAAVVITEEAADENVEEESDVAALDDEVLASAYNGAVTVLQSEIQDEFDNMLSQYVAYYAQYGYNVDEYDTELQASVAQETVQSKLSTAIVRHYAAENGYELTEEKKAELAAQVQTTLDNTREYLESYLSASGYTGDELTQAVEDQLTQAGYSEESLMETAELNDVLNYLYEKATADIAVTEDEVKAAFDEKVATQKENYADLDTFINDYVNENEILYTPEGVRLMECIYIAKVDGEATEDEATKAEATPEESADIAELSGYAKAKAVAASIAGGADFEEAMKAYNEDSSTEEQMLRGYPVAEGSQLYGEEFIAGALALENVGDVSDVITTDYGYFILRYAKDLETGEVDFESRKETETEEALTNKKNDAYTEYVNKVLDEADMQIGDLSKLYHVYVGEAVEATVAYASVNADTQLLDMPGGDAVADVKAGASMDEVLAMLRNHRSRTQQVFTVDDLMHLQRGGRVSRVAAMVGSVLQIKPILESDELGRIIVTSKVRGRKKAVRYLADALRKKIDPNEKQLIGIAHADCKEDAETLEGLIRESCPNAQFLTVKYEPVTGAHVGPGALALFFLSKDTWR